MPKIPPGRPRRGTEVAPPDTGVAGFSTAHWPEHLKLIKLKEFFDNVIKMDIEALPGQPFHADGKIRRLPGLGMSWASGSGMRGWRRHQHITGDDVYVTINLDGERLFHDETVLRAGEGRIVDGRGDATVFRPNRYVSAHVPRRVLGSRLLARKRTVIPAGDDMLQLLRCYLGTFEHAPLGTPAAQQLAVNHVYDLVRMLLGATGDDAALALGRGVSAARLAAIKGDVMAHLAEPDLSVTAVAQRSRISVRYLHRLFEADGTSFGAFMLGLRLARAREMLTDPHCSDRLVSTIGYDAGFNDLSYFYRSFRRHFGMTPADLRVSARRGQRMIRMV